MKQAWLRIVPALHSLHRGKLIGVTGGCTAPHNVEPTGIPVGRNTVGARAIHRTDAPHSSKFASLFETHGSTHG